MSSDKQMMQVTGLLQRQCNYARPWLARPSGIIHRNY